MEYLNIHRSTVEGEAMQDAPAEAVRAWLFLNTYCIGQENGGRIAGARGWSERKWLKLCGLSQEEVRQDLPGQGNGLWRWEGEDLVVEFYPARQEAIIQGKRRAGKAGGKRSGEARGRSRNEAELEAETKRSETDDSSRNEAELERKGREGKEKKGNERERLPGEGSLAEVSIPTEEEVRTWAEMAGVDPDFAAQKWAAANETHGWERNGRLIEWRPRFKRFWEEDRGAWLVRKKNGPTRAGQFQKNGPVGAMEKPAGWQDGDEGWWWSEGLELIEKALHGALLGGQEAQAGRLKEILKVRKE